MAVEIEAVMAERVLPPPFADSIDRAILGAVAEANGRGNTIGSVDLATAAGVPRSVVCRRLPRLHREHYLERPYGRNGGEVLGARAAAVLGPETKAGQSADTRIAGAG
jgi:DNA-binding Lrp family transcriptional regulator